MAIAAGAALVSGLGYAATAALVTSITFSVGTMFAYAVVAAGMSVLSRALAPKPSLGAQLRGITQTTREPAGTRKLIYGQMRVGGNVVFIQHSGSDNKYLHLVVVFATHHINSFEEFYFNDKKIWTLSGGFQGNWGTYVQLNTKLGTDTQDAVSSLVSASSKWTNDHKLSGIAYAHFRLEWDADEFPQGVPNITAVIKGKRVYDPRTQVFAYSDNPALCLRDYMIDQDYGLGEIASNINTQSVIDAANLCEEQVSLDGGGAQDRYTCNGVLDTNNQIKDNIEQLLSAMGGRLTYSGGEYFIHGAEYQAPTVTFDEADCIADVQTQTKQSRRTSYNGVKGIFVSEEKNYKVLDYPPQISSTFATEDGDPIFLDMPLPFVTNNTQAQRLAKIALLKSRQQVIITMSVNLKGLRVKVGDTINVTNERLGYSSKVFEVIDYSLAIADGGSLGVNLTCIETAAAVYDWNTSDQEDFLAGGELELYDGRTVDNVTSLTSSEIGLRGPDGRLKSAVELTWTAPDDAFIEFYTVRFNKNGTTDYLEVQTRQTRALIEGLDLSSNYDFLVQAQNLIGVKSTGTSITNLALNGDTTAPSAPTGGTATGGVQTITAEWDNPSDIDFKHTEVFVNTSNSIPATPTAVVDGEEYIVTGLSGAQTRYFWLKAVDFSGNKSAATASFNGASVVAGTSDIGTGAVTTTQIGDDAVTVTKLANVLQSINYVAGTTGWEITTAGNVEFSNGTFRGTLVVGGTTLSSNNTLNSNQSATDITTGTLDASSITVTNLSADSITAGTLNANRINIDGVTLDVDGSGQLIIANDGVGSAQIANGAIGLTEFASGIQPVQVVGTLPASASEGDMAYLTTDNKLYRYNGSAWIKAVDGADVTSGTLPAAAIVANSLTAGQIAAGAISTDELAANAVTAAKIAVGALQADSITGDVSEHFTFALGTGFDGLSMDSLSSTKKTFDVEINAPSGGVAKRPYIQGVAIADTNNVTGFEFTLEVRLKSGKSYTHDFTGYSRAVTAPYGTSNVNYNVYSGNQITSLALGGIWTSSGDDITPVYGFFYDESANETYLLINDDDGDLQNGDWALTPSTGTTGNSNLCLPRFGAPANGEEHTVPFIIILPETTVATTFMLTYSGSGFLRGLNGEAGYLR